MISQISGTRKEILPLRVDTPEVLWPLLGSSCTSWRGSKEGSQKRFKGSEHLAHGGEAETAATVQPREEKAQGNRINALSKTERRV